MAHGTLYETLRTEHRIIERKDQRALAKLALGIIALGKMAGCVKWNYLLADASLDAFLRHSLICQINYYKVN